MLGVLFVAVLPARAFGDSVREVNIGGAGRDKCSQWVEDRSASSEAARAANERREEWLAGFFSAVNLFTESTGNLHGGVDDRDGMLRQIDDYCRSHPRDPLWLPATNLVFSLKQKERSTK